MKLKYLLAIMAFMMTLGSVNAAEEFTSSIPLELAQRLLGSGNQAATIYSGILEEFPQFTVPENFIVLGSVENSTSQRVVLSTSLESEQAQAKLRNALNSQDWVYIPSRNTSVGVGFIGAQTIRRPERYCHDELGSIQVSNTEQSDSILITLSHFLIRNPQENSCAEQLNSRERFVQRISSREELTKYIPRLELPIEANVGGRLPGGTGSYSSSNGEYSNNTTLSIEWSPAELLEFFSAQINNQDWQTDGQWAGDLAAGGSWSASRANDTELIGVLTIVKSGENDYKLQIRLLTRE